MKRSKFLLTALLTACLAAGGAFFSAPTTAHAVSLSDTYSADTALVDPPSVVFDVGSASALRDLQSAKNGERPASAVFHVGESGALTDGDGGEIGQFSAVEALRAKVIPVFAVESQTAADALSSYLTESGLVDTAVLSGDPGLVASVRENCPDVRGIVRLAGRDAYDCVKTASLAGAGVVVLDAAEATWEKVTFIQSRFKAVWVATHDEFDDYAAITSGAVGIVTEDFSATYDTICGFSEKVYPRMPFNVAHRGLPSTHNENSVSGTRAAIEAGATHVELDGKLTRDNEIVMMHDDDIARTAEGGGNVESMTLAEVKSHPLDLHGSEEIPTLKEIIPLFEGKDAVLVFEIKTKNTALIARLKEILDETDFYDHVVVIAFDYPNLAQMRRLLPEVPTADLNDYNESNFAEKLPLLGRYACAVSTNGSSSEEFNERCLRDRGVIGWYWTQSDEAAVDAAFEKGLVGLTNNVGAYFGAKNDVYRVVLGSRSPETGALSVGSSVPVRAVKYDGSVVEGTGEAVLVRERKSSSDPRDPGYFEVIAKYTSGDMTYYTPAFVVSKESEEKGCFGAVSGAGALLSCGVLLLAALLVVKKK